MEVEGVRLRFSHHGRVGRLPWTLSNLLTRDGYALAIRLMRWGLELPHVWCVGHNHIYAESAPDSPIRVVSGAAWQLATAHAMREPESLADIGGLLIWCNADASRGQAGMMGTTEQPGWRIEAVLYRPEAGSVWCEPEAGVGRSG